MKKHFRIIEHYDRKDGYKYTVQQWKLFYWGVASDYFGLLYYIHFGKCYRKFKTLKEALDTLETVKQRIEYDSKKHTKVVKEITIDSPS